MGQESAAASREQLSRSPTRLSLLTALALITLGAVAGPGHAVSVCRGIKRCVPVEGPWVEVRSGHETDFVLTCPKGGVVAGVDASATTPAVRLSFDGRLGAPVSPGITTSSDAFFRAIVVRRRVAFFQPWLGCLVVGGGGRSTVSFRRSSVRPGPALDRRPRLVRLKTGEKSKVAIACPAGEQLVSGWGTIAFYAKKPPPLHTAAQVGATRPAMMNRQVVVHAIATRSLPANAHALLQVGASCAP